MSANQRAMALLQNIRSNDPDLWRMIAELPDGIRSALTRATGGNAAVKHFAGQPAFKPSSSSRYPLQEQSLPRDELCNGRNGNRHNIERFRQWMPEFWSSGIASLRLTTAVDTRRENRIALTGTPPVRFGNRARGCRLAASAFYGMYPIRANIYIDGLNLYYRALQGTPHRWLDLGQLVRLLLPNHPIGRIRYFTALVANRPGDPTQAQRQQAYLRALATVPDLTIHYGHLLAKTKRRPLVRPPQSGPRTVEILDTEEKGSDVNLASYLLLDGFDDEYDLAVVISNDSDPMLPIGMVRDRLRKQVGVFDPSRRRSFELHGAASWYRPLRQGPLSASQFPDTFSDSQGIVSKPSGW